MDNSNSTKSSPTVNRVYSILAPMGVVLLVAIVMLISYFFANRRRNATRSIRLSGATAPSDHDTDDDDVAAVELGLDEATILRYPMLLYAQAKKDQSNSNASLSRSTSTSSSSSSSSCSCSICLIDYKENDTVRILPECKHFFHVKCVDPWLKLNSTCPVCRKPLIRHLSNTQSTAGDNSTTTCTTHDDS